MAIMTQDQMRILVADNPLDDRGMDILNVHLSAIAVAALGAEEAPLRAALNAYANDLEQEAEGVVFLRPSSEKDFKDCLSWLRAMPIH